jgi:hypothetical protein
LVIQYHTPRHRHPFSPRIGIPPSSVSASGPLYTAPLGIGIPRTSASSVSGVGILLLSQDSSSQQHLSLSIHRLRLVAPSLQTSIAAIPTHQPTSLSKHTNIPCGTELFTAIQRWKLRFPNKHEVSEGGFFSNGGFGGFPNRISLWICQLPNASCGEIMYL